MNNKFVALFQEFGYTVEQVGEDSFIADNGVFCIPYTEYDNSGKPEMYAITIDSCHKEELKERFKDEKYIGRAAWCRGVPFKIYTNNICKQMQKKNESITFYSVQKKTGASKSFLYNNEEIAKTIKDARTVKTEPKSKDSEKIMISALRKRIRELEEELKKERSINKNSYKDKCEKLQEENRQLKEQLKKSYVAW